MTAEEEEVEEDEEVMEKEVVNKKDRKQYALLYLSVVGIQITSFLFLHDCLRTASNVETNLPIISISILLLRVT